LAAASDAPIPVCTDRPAHAPGPEVAADADSSPAVPEAVAPKASVAVAAVGVPSPTGIPVAAAIPVTTAIAVAAAISITAAVAIAFAAAPAVLGKGGPVIQGETDAFGEVQLGLNRANQGDA
jgi:hypothetical protein